MTIYYFHDLENAMNVHVSKFKFAWKRTLLLSAAAALTVSLAHAQSKPGMELEASSVSSAGSATFMTYVPVKNAKGEVHYKDLEIQYSVDEQGSVSVAPGFPKISDSKLPFPDRFRAGTYKDSFGLKYLVKGPAEVEGGRSYWQLSFVSGQKDRNSNPLDGALEISWVTGPVSGHPDAALPVKEEVKIPPYTLGHIGVNTLQTFMPSRQFTWLTVSVQAVADQLVIHGFKDLGARNPATMVLQRCASENCR
jgi:hypothetical protein